MHYARIDDESFCLSSFRLFQWTHLNAKFLIVFLQLSSMNMEINLKIKLETHSVQYCRPAKFNIQ